MLNVYYDIMSIRKRVPTLSAVKGKVITYDYVIDANNTRYHWHVVDARGGTDLV